MKWKTLWTIITILVVCSCTHNERLEYALEFAGTNRLELEKVLTHYKDSGQKYDAARFLIENMPRYYAYEGAELDSMKVVQAGLFKKWYLNEEQKAKWKMFSYQRLDKVYDAKVITADYLIENIDLAFKAWQERPWSKSISFEEFCEWILPYRIGNEPLENWRKPYYEKYSALLDSLYKGSDVIVAADSLMRKLMKHGYVFNEELKLPRLGAMFLEKQCVGYCRETCDYTAYAFRSVGIPTGTDMLITTGSHLWSAIKDSTGGVVATWFEPLIRGGNDGRKKGKVYRLCFGVQEEKIPGMWTEPEVPRNLKNPYVKDVTSDYFGENKTDIELQEKPSGKYVYVGIFSNLEWEAIDIADFHGRKATIKDVEPEVVYVPLAWSEKDYRVMGYPFKLTKNGVYYYRPGNEVEKVKLYRKFPLRKWTRYHLAGIVGSKIEASNTLDFKHAELLCQIVDTPKTNYIEVPCALKQKYRYVRFTAPKDKLARIGELLLFRSAGEDGKIELKAVEGSEPDFGNKDVAKEKVCDQDFLTYFLSHEKGGYVTLDLGKPEHIEQLVYVPRNDDNFITSGDVYELFYQDGANGWVSLGQQVTNEHHLDYDNVPKNALLWLRNLSRGKEELLFRMENGEQVFLGE